MLGKYPRKDNQRSFYYYPYLELLQKVKLSSYLPVIAQLSKPIKVILTWDT